MKKYLGVSALFILLACGINQDQAPADSEVLLEFSISKDFAGAGVVYVLTVCAEDIDTVGPLEYHGGDTARIFVPEGRDRRFYFERFVGGVLVDTGSTFADVVRGKNLISVNLIPAMPLPDFTSHPRDTTVAEGKSVLLQVTATGQNLTYQWLKNGEPVSGGSGAQTASYTTPQLSLDDNGSRYRCVATNLAGVDTSGTAVITVQAKQTDTVSVSITTIGAITAGSYKNIAGDIDANVNIESVTYTIKDFAGATGTSMVTVSSQSVNGIEDADLIDDAYLKINTTPNACNGTYTLSIKVVAGTAEATQTATFTIVGGSSCTGTDVTVTTLAAIGSNNASAGSSIDLDAGAVYTSSQAATHVADLDICYSYSGTTSEDKLFTPSHAKASGYSYAANWTNPPTTQIVKTSLTPAEFAAVATVEEIAAEFATGTAITTSVACAEDDVFVVETTDGAYVMILIDAQTPGATGTITVTVKMAK